MRGRFAALLLLACAARRPLETASVLRGAQEDLAAGRTGEAQRGFEEVLAREPQELAAIRGRIQAAQARGALEAVKRDLQAPQTWTDFYALGLARAAGNEDGAAVAFAAAARMRPDIADIRYRLGVALLRAARPVEARDALSSAVDLAPSSARYRPALASCLDGLGDTSGALKALQPVASLGPSPEEAAAAVKMARALTDLFRGVPREARPRLEEALEYLRRNAPGLALPPLEALLSKHPDLGPAHALLGLAAARLDDPGRALAELQRAAELLPDSPQPHAWLATLYASKGEPDSSLSEWESAAHRNPLGPAVLRQVGELRLARGAPGALEALRDAAALDPSDDPLQLLLARAEIEAGKSDIAETRLEQLARRRPDDGDLQLRVATLLFEHSQRSAAGRPRLTRRVESLLERVLTLQPENAAANRLLIALRSR